VKTTRTKSKPMVSGYFGTLAVVLSRELGVKVIPSDGACCTDCRTTIALPIAAEHLPDDSARILDGLLDHESGHIRCVKLDEELGRVPIDKVEPPGTSPQLHTIMNGLIDGRDQIKMTRLYPGVSENFDHSYRWGRDSHLRNVEEYEKTGNPALAPSLFRNVVCVLTSIMRGYDPSPWGEEANDLVRTHLADEVRDGLRLVDEFGSPEEFFSLSKRVLSKLGDLAEEPPPPPPGPGGEGDPTPGEDDDGDPSGGQGGEEDEDDDQDGEGEGDEDEDGDAQGEGDDEDEDGPQDDGDGPGETNGDEDEGEDEGEGEDGSGSGDGQEDDEDGDDQDGEGDDEVDDDQDGEGEGGGDEDSDSRGGEPSDKCEGEVDSVDPDYGDGGGGIGPALRTALKEDLEALECDDDPVDGAARRHLDEQCKRSLGRVHIPHPVALAADRVCDPLEFTSASRQELLKLYHSIKNQVTPEIGRLRSQLLRALKCQQAKKLRVEQEDGESLHDGSLYKLISGGDERVFRKRLPGLNLDTDLSILTDQSGSMSGGGKIETARKAVIALTETCASIKVPVEVLGWDTGETVVYPNPPYNRGENQRYRVYKTHDEPLNDTVRARLASMGSGIQNCDSEAVAWAADRLQLRRSKRKVLLVLSDGHPASSTVDSGVDGVNIRRVVDRAFDAGIEVVSIGIKTDAPRYYYPVSIVLHDISALSKTLVGILDALLRQGKRVVRKMDRTELGV